jgi:hypothetical protein
VPFENLLDENRIFMLNSALGFDKSIHRFVSKFYPMNSQGISEISDIKIVNKDNIDSDFIPLVNPEKVVQFVSVKGSVVYENNRLNKSESKLYRRAY